MVSIGAMVSMGAAWLSLGADISSAELSAALLLVEPELQAVTNKPRARANAPTFITFFIINGFF